MLFTTVVGLGRVVFTAVVVGLGRVVFTAVVVFGEGAVMSVVFTAVVVFVYLMSKHQTSNILFETVRSSIYYTMLASQGSYPPMWSGNGPLSWCQQSSGWHVVWE